MNKPKRIFFILCLLAILCCGLILKAQSTLTPTYITGNGHLLKEIRWSTDSKVLAFFQGGWAAVSVEPSEFGSWVAYDTRTNLFVPTTLWPLKPRLTLTQRTALGIEPLQFASVSPNGRYIVYPGGPNHRLEIPAQSVMIGDLQTGQSFATSANLVSPDFGPDGFNVIWSQSGDAFILGTQSLEGGGLIYEFVSGYGANLANATVQPIGRFDVAGQPFNADYPFDVSADGTRLLIGGVNADDQHLAIWDPSDPTQNRAIGYPGMTQVLGAHFVLGDENQILIFTSGGLVRYDLKAQHATYLGLANNDIQIGKALFSPDGNWLAIVEADVVLYLIDVQHSPNAVLPPPSTLTPTVFIPPLKLQLFPVCSPDPDRFRVWKVVNPNPFNMTFLWHLVDTDEQGSGIVPGVVNHVPGALTFSTPTQADRNTLTILTTIEIQATQDSVTVPCSAAATLAPTLGPTAEGK